MPQDLTRADEGPDEAATETTLSARVNERHGHGDSMFIEPTPREIHDLLELAAEDDGRPAT